MAQLIPSPGQMNQIPETITLTTIALFWPSIGKCVHKDKYCIFNGDCDVGLDSPLDYFGYADPKYGDPNLEN